MKNINDMNNNDDFKPEIQFPNDQNTGVGEDLRPEIEKPGIGNDQWETEKETELPDQETPWQNY